MRISIPVSVLFLLFLAPATWPQDADEPSSSSETVTTDAEESAEPDPEAEEEPVEFDETGLDEQGFSNEDDDFAPSEDIPTDQSIEFPADI